MEWSESNSLLLYQDKVYIPNILDLHCCVVSFYYNLRIAEYAG